MKARNLFIRSLSGSAYVAAIVFAILIKNPAVYVALFSLFALVGIWEYSKLAKNNRTRPLRHILDGLAAAYLFSATLFASISEPDRIMFVPYIFYLIYIIIRGLFTESDTFPSDLSKTVFGQLYIAGGLSMANFIAFSKMSSDFIDFQTYFLLTIFILIWLNDTGAYLVGSLMGKHKMAKIISPKKTWEGFAGGVVVSVIGAVLLGDFFVQSLQPWYLWAVLGVVVAVAATWGDLFESRLKRIAGVKDSGKIIPGHGGILDRIDSLLFALPLSYITIQIIGL